MALGIGFFELVIVLAILGAMGVGLVLAILAVTSRKSGALPTANPNLYPCADCGQLISLRAATCPHCGGPTVHK